MGGMMTGRKISMLVLSILVVLSAFMAIRNVSKTPKMRLRTADVADMNGHESKVGNIGEFGIGKVEEARFVDYSTNKNVVREVGFSRLISQESDRWEIEKPFINITRDKVKFSLTADNGIITVDNAAAESKLEDAYLEGNVRIIITDEGKPERTSYQIKMDNIKYVSNKSQFYTKGKIQFNSTDIELEGQGLEIIYNFDSDKLHKIQIDKLDKLTVNNVSLPRQKEIKAASTDAPQAPPQVSTAARDENNKQTAYRCMLNDNVIINAPDEIIGAKNLTIRNIFIDSIMKKNAPKKEGAITFEQPAAAQETVIAPKDAVLEPKGQYFVSCGTVLILPIDKTEPLIEQKDCRIDDKTVEYVLNSDKQVRVVANTIDYDRSSGDCFTKGKTEFLFYVNDITDNSSKKDSVPAMLHADDGVIYKSRTAEVAFAGNCMFTLLKQEKDATSQWSLAAPKINVNLSKIGAMKVDKITAYDNVEIQNTSANNPQENVKLTAKQIEYDATTEQVNARENVKISFYAAEPAKTKTASRIPCGLSSDSAKFYFDIKQGDFEGNCYFWADSTSSPQADSEPNNGRGYQLWADKLSVDLSRDINAGVDHMTAENNVVIKIASDKNANREARFTTKKVEYDKVTADVIASGQSELLFYTNSMGANRTPVTISTQNKVSYFINSGQAVFDGNNICTMQTTEDGLDKTYVMNAPKLEVNFSKETSDVKNIYAGPENVRVHMVKKQAEKYFGGIELKCKNLDFDAIGKIVKTAGPGLLKVDNSQAQEQAVTINKDAEVKELYSTAAPKDIERHAKEITWWNKTGGFNMQKKCYAFVRDFNSLKMDMKENKIIASSTKKDKLLIDYVPFLNGKFEPAVRITSHRLQAAIDKTNDGHLKLNRLYAGGGVTYEDPENSFVGSSFFYDAKESLITASGDENYKCMLNGSIVQSVEYNLQTGSIKGEVDIISVLKN